MVHHLRNQVDAVIVGVGTAIADDPQLTCRITGGRDPWRVILDSHLRVPLSARIFRQADPAKSIVVTGPGAPRKKIRALESLGARVWKVKLRKRRIPWRAILKQLAAKGALSVMIEGGATTAAWALEEKVVDKVLFFYAPMILGGDGRVMIDTLRVKRIRQAIRIRDMQVRRSGNDTLVSGYVCTG